jgi:hypothetical protein
LLSTLINGHRPLYDEADDVIEVYVTNGDNMLAMMLLPLSAALVCSQPPTKAEPNGAQRVRNEPLRQELLTMMREDQAARESMLKKLGEGGIPFNGDRANSDPQAVKVMQQESQKVQQVDDRNRARLREIVEQHGWPGAGLVGKDAALAAWLIVQHADSDRAFQKKCLTLMEAAPKGDVDQADVAYLTDRVLVGEKKLQRYGTQLEAGFKPFPIEDEKNVDKRRAAVGLAPLAEYLKDTREAYEKYQGKKVGGK